MPPKSTALAGLTPLQSRVAREIVAFARRENLKAGEHLAESVLAERIGTSRSPVNVALRHLAKMGVLSHDLNRGYFLNKDAGALNDVAQRFSSQPDDPLYLRIAADRLAHRLPDLVNEADLMRLYRTSRSTLRKVLSRIQQEGWVEKSVGHGWLFQPLIDSPEAYEESYVFRAAIEPTGLLSSSFKADPAELASLRRQQQFIVDGGYQTMTAIELFESNSQFHETLAKWSGNRFILQAVRRTDQLRRLVEYGQARERAPRRTQAGEHLAILDAIAEHDMLKAAALMRGHLEGARRAKVYGGNVFTTNP
ncbi:MAG TPA: GntR family transcriptional regulator [Burkholderiaceae bacterium]|nr:GntR family transcriptional regulator [Burkholderiaceae bacterium]